jgi:hypothetical protein
MRRLHALLTLLLLAQAPLVQAQRDSSLTSEFARMSARERARVAREEEAAAATDTAFQAMMQQGEEHFRAARYEEALASYQRARSRRPLNVHPKVKIQDLEALIARQQQEAVEAPPVEVTMPRPDSPAGGPPEDEVPPAMVVPPMVEPQHVEQPAPAEVPASTDRAPATSLPATPSPPVPAARTDTAPAVVRAPVPQPAPADPLTEGVRIFREGRAVVEERVVQEGDRLVVWRKVVHPWGEVVHFRDNEAVPARRWQERFGGY